jgi:hypothetical protein
MKFRTILAGAAALALSTGLTLGVAASATAAPAPAPAAASATAPSYTFVFNLLVPNAPVTFTVDGVVVGTGTTNSNGDVTITYSPTGLAPGYYRLVATTSYGIWSSIGFGVR